MPKNLLPQEFIQNIKAILPPHLSIESFVDICQVPLRKSIRINTLLQPAPNEIGKLFSAAEPVPWCEQGLWLNETPDYQLGNHVCHLNGQFYIQEASSMLPPMALAHVAKSMNLVLDMASAPGSKTTQIAGLMNNRGGLVANELSASRLKFLHANLQRCGVTNAALTHFDAAIFGAALPNTFDAVLLDAPCSGEGSLRKDPDAMKNWNMESIERISEVQKTLIESAFHALKAGGAMVYSTCTLSAQENQNVCQHLLDTFGDNVEVCSLHDLFDGAAQSVTAEGYLHVWPQIYDSEGFFVAAFRKQSATAPDQSEVRRPGRFPYHFAKRDDIEQLQQYLDGFGFTLPNDMELFERNDTFWLFPKALEPLFGKLKFQRIGIRVAERFKRNYKLDHGFAIAYGHQFKHLTFELNAEQAQEYLQGRDVRGIEGLPNKGECLATYEGKTLGFGKAVANRLKNQLPREIVRDQPVMNSTKK
ncbi:16S rRNA (cytosine(1407)-C(5))-methyltransferase RsmF [Echinimonas agarilytica]|uniref:16S rRNA (Cytosine(1407)-C(5))-methyltransferase RsmF n=1 Tax=Echinimonas agarilytica TaxID=1215918 RepID=A0AA42B7P2_9GAMM|nr:16S rRNA (cytosine(1407)-C(5))-methyltransferase RsmF [Echinimonas agarilytica]MCM2679972.1 16S rRNA (cytosine(1407)-C(5))-methyltransferase RsmF [Echinimonas agarilytica]